MSDLFFEKEDWFLEAKSLYNLDFIRVAPANFYRSLFPFGSFQEEQGEDYVKNGKGNGFLVFKTNKGKMHTRIVFDNHFEIWEYLRKDTVFMSPVSYFGKNRTLSNARLLFAFVFDLDEVSAKRLMYFFSYVVKRKTMPMPTYVVNSGNGVHLYYLFEDPIPLYPNIQRQLKNLKYALTKLMWNIDTSGLKTPQYQGINQGFRLVGSGTKQGHTVTAWKIGEKVSLEYLSSFVDVEFRVTDTLYRSKLTLEEAEKKYPEWYHQRIELKRQKKNWTCHRALYDWWKNQLPHAKHHHRYFYIMCLTIYAVKSGISFDELKKDAYSFQKELNNLNPADPFTEHDIESALEMYQECYRSFPRDEISKLSGIEIKANKRNGRKQVQHLKIARFTRDLNQDEKGTKWNGRKSYEDAVFQFLAVYPNASYKEFCELTGMGKDVFYKYKKQFLNKKKPRTYNPGDTISPQP